MKNMWKKIGSALAASALLMTMPAWAGDGVDLQTVSSNEEEALSLFGDLDGDALSLFEGNTSDGTDALSAADSYAYDGDVIALDDLGISVTAKNYDIALQDEGQFVYIYMDGEYIPYVMIKRYDTGWDEVPEAFVESFTEYMSESYPDLWVAEDISPLTLNGNTFLRIRYEYAISGFTASDTRLFTQWNNRTFMFASKEISSRGDVLPGGYLEQVAASMAPLAGGDSDYEKHVDSTRTVKGPGPSVGSIGGFGNSVPTGTPDENPGQNGSSGQDGNPEQTTTGTTSGTDISVGAPVGSSGTVGREQAPSQGGIAGSITFAENDADYSGVWVEFTDGFKLYLPDTWNTYNLTQAQYDNGIFYMAGDTSNQSAAAGIGVSYMEKGDMTLESIQQMFREDGCEVDELFSVNGIVCVSYMSEEEDCCGLVFFHPEGLDYLFMLEAFNYSGNVDTLATVLCSLTPTV